MRVLIACEYSARVRDAFIARGHDAVSCDLEPTEGDPYRHYQGDVFDLLDHRQSWDLLIAFPPCTYLTNSNAWRWDAIEKERIAALAFVARLMDQPIARIAVENPAGAIGTQIRKADQYVQPWHFGEPYQKTTGLWLKGLPKLIPDVQVKPDGVGPWVSSGYGPRTGSATTASGRVYTNGARRSVERSRTFPGIARAMAEQWG